jgi:hypothetical protein
MEEAQSFSIKVDYCRKPPPFPVVLLRMGAGN